MPSSVFPRFRARINHPIENMCLCFRYSLESYIETRSVGELWSATDILLRRRVMVQFIRPELSPNYTSEGREARSQFGEEIDTIIGLGIDSIGLIERGELPGGQLFVVYEWMEGEWLDVLVERRQSLSSLQTVSLLIQLSEVLQRCHRAGIIHEGIHKENIRVSISGTQIKCYLCDFGIAGLRRLAEDENLFLHNRKKIPQDKGRLSKLTESLDVLALSRALWSVWDNKELSSVEVDSTGTRIEDSSAMASWRVHVLFEKMLFMFSEEFECIHADDLLLEAFDIWDECFEEKQVSLPYRASHAKPSHKNEEDTAWRAYWRNAS